MNYSERIKEITLSSQRRKFEKGTHFQKSSSVFSSLSSVWKSVDVSIQPVHKICSWDEKVVKNKNELYLI